MPFLLLLGLGIAAYYYASPKASAKGSAFAIGLEGKEIQNANSHDVVLEMLGKLGIPSLSIFDGKTGYSNGTNVLMFALQPGDSISLPKVGTLLTVTGIPLRVSYVQQLPMSTVSNPPVPPGI